MPARHVSQAAVERMIAESEELRRERARNTPAPEVVNVGHAIALGDPIPLLWGETEYRVKPISYRDGLRLQRASLEVARQAKTPPQDAEGMDDLERFLEGVLDLMHSLLDPRPAANPFLDASPWEVGELLGFFSRCLTMQRDQSRLRTRDGSRSTSWTRSRSTSAPSPRG